MVKNILILATPGLAWVFEKADEFFLLAIDTDDRPSLSFELSTLASDVQELTVSTLAMTGLGFESGLDSFAVRSEGELHFQQQARHRAGADLDVRTLQLLGDVSSRAARPAQAADGVSSDVIFQQLLNALQDVRSFFSTACRPPPRLRMRVASISPLSNSLRPRATE